MRKRAAFLIVALAVMAVYVSCSPNSCRFLGVKFRKSPAADQGPQRRETGKEVLDAREVQHSQW
jgi:hypothetical protein